jgi:hypothetical protein
VKATFGKAAPEKKKAMKVKKWNSLMCGKNNK